MPDHVYTRIVCRDLYDTGAGTWLEEPVSEQNIGCEVTVCGLIVHETDLYVSVSVAIANSDTLTHPSPRGAFHIPKACIILRRDKPFILTPDHATPNNNDDDHGRTTSWGRTLRDGSTIQWREGHGFTINDPHGNPIAQPFNVDTVDDPKLQSREYSGQ